MQFSKYLEKCEAIYTTNLQYEKLLLYYKITV